MQVKIMTLEFYDWGRKEYSIVGGTSNSTAPLTLSSKIKDIIKDKVFCDLGCGEGDFALCCKRFASKVIAVEMDPDRAEIARMKGLNVIEGNLLSMNIPDADVYYIWIGYKTGIVYDRIVKGKTVILGPQVSLREWVDSLKATKKSMEYIRNGIKMTFDWYVIVK